MLDYKNEYFNRYLKTQWDNKFLGGNELVSSEYVCFSISFMNSSIIHSHPHVTFTPDFYFVYKFWFQS